MSNIPFVESVSADPVERAIARRVSQILQDPALGHQHRAALVRAAQQELLAHRQCVQQQWMAQHIAAVPLPAGARVTSVVVRDDRLLLGVQTAQQSFVWLDAGPAPAGKHLRHAVAVPPPAKTHGARKVRKDLAQAIAERRKALGFASTR